MYKTLIGKVNEGLKYSQIEEGVEHKLQYFSKINIEYFKKWILSLEDIKDCLSDCNLEIIQINHSMQLAIHFKYNDIIFLSLQLAWYIADDGSEMFLLNNSKNIVNKKVLGKMIQVLFLENKCKALDTIGFNPFEFRMLQEFSKLTNCRLIDRQDNDELSLRWILNTNIVVRKKTYSLACELGVFYQIQISGLKPANLRADNFKDMLNQIIIYMEEVKENKDGK